MGGLFVDIINLKFGHKFRGGVGVRRLAMCV